MQEALSFIERLLCKPSTVKLLKFLLENNYASSTEIKDERLIAGIRHELFYTGILKKFRKDGRKHYTLTGEGAGIAEALVNLVDEVHNIVEEIEEVY